MFDLLSEYSVIVFISLCNWVLSALNAEKTNWGLLRALVCLVHIFCAFWHLQCCVLATHSAMVRLNVAPIVHIKVERETSINLSWNCLGCVHKPYSVGR